VAVRIIRRRRRLRSTLFPYTSLFRSPLKKRLSEIVPTTTRKLIVVGCGDGGCNIASAIANRIPDETFTIAYNTSDRNIQKITARSEEHTSELQSRFDLVCRLLLEKKK